MKKRTINCSIPATLSFSKEEQNENERFTRGKLRVFYKGETPDHRLFNDTFSESIIKSLPYTPIVSYYDEKKTISSDTQPNKPFMASLILVLK